MKRLARALGPAVVLGLSLGSAGCGRPGDVSGAIICGDSGFFAGCLGAAVGDPCNADGTDCTVDRCVDNDANGSPDACEFDMNAASGTSCTDEDMNPCTTDVCNGSGTCVSSTAPCDDGQFCTVGDACAPITGTCTGTPLTCLDDGDPCTVETCDEAMNACVSAPAAEGEPCDDGMDCTAGEACAGGTCTGGGPAACSDGEECTLDSCVESASPACQNVPVSDGTSCGASGGCLLDGTCSGGVCTGAMPAPATTPCDDGSLCTTADACNGSGACVGDPVDCTDTNPCTVENCTPTLGCRYPFAASGTPCDDLEACTENDQCDAAGACAGTPMTGCSGVDAGGDGDGGPRTETYYGCACRAVGGGSSPAAHDAATGGALALAFALALALALPARRTPRRKAWRRPPPGEPPR